MVFLHFLARDCENFKFLGDLISFLGDVGGGGGGGGGGTLKKGFTIV